MIRIVTLTGASGSGKSTIIKGVLSGIPRLVELVRSTTTRLKRPSDLDGEYEYISRPKFDAWEKNGVFLWTVEMVGVGDEKYGTLKTLVDFILNNPKGKIGLMLLKPEAVLTLKSYTEAKLGQQASTKIDSIFINSPPTGILRERMLKRGDSEKSVERRLEECKDWDHIAHTSRTPAGERTINHFIDNHEGRENLAVAHVILRILELRRHV